MRYLLICAAIIMFSTQAHAQDDGKLTQQAVAQIYYNWSEKSKNPDWWSGLPDTKRRFYALILTSIRAVYYSAWIQRVRDLPHEERQKPLCKPDNILGVKLEDMSANIWAWATQAMQTADARRSPMVQALAQAGQSSFSGALSKCGG